MLYFSHAKHFMLGEAVFIIAPLATRAIYIFHVREPFCSAVSFNYGAAGDSRNLYFAREARFKSRAASDTYFMHDTCAKYFARRCICMRYSRLAYRFYDRASSRGMCIISLIRKAICSAALFQYRAASDSRMILYTYAKHFCFA